MKFAFYFTIFDHHADAELLAELAVEVEEAGWDRVLVWDHVNLADYGFADGGPHVDPWMALALMADRTERIELGTYVTPIPRRRPVKLAREILTLQQLSGGRFVFGGGLGAGASEFDQLGEETNPRTRGQMLDESLEILQRVFAGEALDHHGDHYNRRRRSDGRRPGRRPDPGRRDLAESPSHSGGQPDSMASMRSGRASSTPSPSRMLRRFTPT